MNGNGDRNTPFVLSSLMKSRGVKQGVSPLSRVHTGGKSGGELKKRPNDFMSGQQREWDRNKSSNAGRKRRTLQLVSVFATNIT